MAEKPFVSIVIQSIANKSMCALIINAILIHLGLDYGLYATDFKNPAVLYIEIRLNIKQIRKLRYNTVDDFADHLIRTVNRADVTNSNRKYEIREVESLATDVSCYSQLELVINSNSLDK